MLVLSSVSSKLFTKFSGLLAIVESAGYIIRRVTCSPPTGVFQSKRSGCINLRDWLNVLPVNIDPEANNEAVNGPVGPIPPNT